MGEEHSRQKEPQIPQGGVSLVGSWNSRRPLCWSSLNDARVVRDAIRHVRPEARYR